MKLALDVRKSLEENAAVYFDNAKKARGKIDGAKTAIERARKQQEKAAKSQEAQTVSLNVPKKIRKRSWYEKFKWFVASNNMLVIAGRDATTNEIAVRKHVDKHDKIFHTGAPGSPFAVLKTEGEETPDTILQEVADFCASHSKAWKLGLTTAEVYWVNPEQVTKEAKAGEYMSKGSFMVYGKRNFLHPKVGLVAVPYEDKIMVAPLTAAKAHFAGFAAKVSQGSDKTSDAAKKVLRILGCGEPDDVVPHLPSGGCKIEKISLSD